MFLVGALLLLAGPSMAQTTNDPSAGSPAGAIYQLPVGGGRADAAPKDGGDGEGGSAAATGGSGGQTAGNDLYRSENNFGTSSRVPGDPRRSAEGAPSPDASQAAAVDTGSTSEAAAFSLLGLIIAGGIGIGLISRRSWS
jgi:hypothetical protein